MLAGVGLQSIHEHIGAKVNIPSTPGQAILRYVGEINGKSGIFGGLELLGSIAALKGKNSGDVDGIKYFEVQEPGSGLFIPLDRLKLLNPQLSRPPSRRSSAALSFSSATSPPSPKENLPKTTPRLGIPRATLRVSSSRPASRIGSLNGISEKTSNGGSGNSYITSDTESRLQAMTASKNCLEKELDALRLEHKRSSEESNEKLSILNELQRTVETLQPLLETYEKDLVEKDNKLSRQRKDFEKAREEWRESLDVLVNTHQEAEDFYESEIEKLSKMVSKLRQKAANVGENPDSLNNEELEKLQMEKTLLEKELNAKILELEVDLQRAEKSESELRVRNGAMAKTQLDLNNELTSLKLRLEVLSLEVTKQSESQQNNKDISVSDMDEWKLQSNNKFASLEAEFALYKKNADEKLASVTEELEKTVLLLKEKNNELTELLEKKNLEISQNLSASNTRSLEIEDNLKNENSKLQDIINSTNLEIEKIQASFDAEKEKNAKLLSDLKLQEELEIKLNETIESLKSENTVLSTTIETLKNQNNLSEDNSIKYEELLKDHEESQRKLKESHEESQRKLKETHESVQRDLLESNKSLKEEHESVHSELLDSNKKLKDQFEELSKKHKTFVIEFNAAKEKKDNLEGELLSSKSLLKKSKSENNSLILKLNDSAASIKKLDTWKLTSESQFKEFETTIKAKDNFIAELQEQLKQQKSNDDSEDVKKLKTEIETLKNELHENSNLEVMIEQLKKDFELRPTFDELTELQNKIQEIETLHKWETEQLSKELKEVLESKSEIENQLQATASELKLLKEELNNFHKDTTVSSAESSVSIGLPVYTPKVPIDPSGGKVNWCGLCEREGHDSVHCPYENDLF